MNKKTRVFLFVLLFAIAFTVRAAISASVNKEDILVINDWSKNLYKNGIKGSYFRDGWVYSSPTQPPLMLMFYWLSGWFYENKYVLSALHNIVRVPPTFILLWIHENGNWFFAKLWGILADCLAAILSYAVIFKAFKKPKIAFWAAILILFNPVAIFESAVWGQTDMFSSLFGLLSFLVFNKRLGKLFSPLLFAVGVSLKPTILVLLPFYLVFVLREIILSSPKERKGTILMFMFGLVLSLELMIISFIPFWDQSKPFYEFIKNVVLKRLIPSSKGTIRVATSAFNFYTVLFNVEKTTIGYKIGFFTLKQLGTFMFILINLLGFSYLFRKRETSTEFPVLLFFAYFVSEGTFLFDIGMAERYFFPAFLFIYLLFFLVKDIKIKIAICFQFILWFLNLYLTFSMRNFSLFNNLLRGNNHLGTRVLSLLNVLIFVFISIYFFTILKNKGKLLVVRN